VDTTFQDVPQFPVEIGIRFHFKMCQNWEGETWSFSVWRCTKKRVSNH